MSNVNRRVGNRFERELCLSLSGYGFWAHNMAQNAQGQPFDVITAKNGKAYPIDCKVCENDTFRLSRIEENQYAAMTLWKMTGNGDGWFALRLSNGAVYMFPLVAMEKFMRCQKSLSCEDIQSQGIPFESWVRMCE